MRGLHIGSALWELIHNDGSTRIGVLAEEMPHRGGYPYPKDPFSWAGLSDFAEARGGRPLSGTPADLIDAAAGLSGATYFWKHESRIFRAGPSRPDVEALLVADNGTLERQVVEAEVMGLVRDAVSTRNPWRREAEVLEVASRPGSGGLRGKYLVAAWKDRVLRGMEEADSPPLGLQRAGEADTRRFLSDVSRREMRLRRTEGYLAFRLELAGRAPVLAFECHKPSEAAHFVCNMGAGRLLRVHALRFPGEPGSPGQWMDGALDFGDLRVWLFQESDELLDGTSLAAVASRRAKAARDAGEQTNYVGDQDEGEEDKAEPYVDAPFEDYHWDQ